MNLIRTCSRILPKLNYFRASKVRAAHTVLHRSNQSLQPARIEHIPSARCSPSGSQPFCTYRPFSISTTNNIKGLSNSVNTESEYFQSTPTSGSNCGSIGGHHDAVNLEPSAADVSSDTLTQVSDFASLGLGGYSPTGLVQTALELIHNTTHIPWWASIVVLTLAVRLTVLPIAVKLNINAARMANVSPERTVLLKRINERSAAGDRTGRIEAAVELQKFYAKQKVNPLASFLSIFQVPIFLSVFLALRGMAELPVESFRTGGMYWFTDLTVADPTFLLPLIACVSFIVNIEMGNESGAASRNSKIMWILRLSPIAILPITINFPAAMFMYWIANSLISSVQTLAFKVPYVKKALGIPLKRIVIPKPYNIKT